MKVKDITRKINIANIAYVDIIDFYTRENYGSIGDDYILGGNSLEFLENMEVMMIDVVEDDFRLYVKGEK